MAYGRLDGKSSLGEGVLHGSVRSPQRCFGHSLGVFYWARRVARVGGGGKWCLQYDHIKPYHMKSIFHSHPHPAASCPIGQGSPAPRPWIGWAIPLIARTTAWTLLHTHPPCPWENCLPWNWSLVPKRLGTAAIGNACVESSMLQRLEIKVLYIMGLSAVGPNRNSTALCIICACKLKEKETQRWNPLPKVSSPGWVEPGQVLSCTRTCSPRLSIWVKRP